MSGSNESLGESGELSTRIDRAEFEKRKDERLLPTALDKHRKYQLRLLEKGQPPRFARETPAVLASRPREGRGWYRLELFIGGADARRDAFWMDFSGLIVDMEETAEGQLQREMGYLLGEGEKLGDYLEKLEAFAEREQTQLVGVGTDKPKHWDDH